MSHASRVKQAIKDAMAASERAYREEALSYARMNEAELDAAAVARAESDTITTAPGAFEAQVEFRKRWVRERAATGRALLERCS